MELFHAVTQSIENVLTCDWYTSFKTFKMDGAKSDDRKTMDTEPGGESTQYVWHLLLVLSQRVRLTGHARLGTSLFRHTPCPLRSSGASWLVCKSTSIVLLSDPPQPAQTRRKIPRSLKSVGKRRPRT